jgi:sucrose-6-phosphate hydrolase SacC (GH32 family)
MLASMPDPASVLACLASTALWLAGPAEPEYAEALRPQFHFTARRNWLNDPNGLVFFAGEYHLFFQHNPRGTEWGNMTWGHAVGPDLVHWRQLDDALTPDSLGTIFSGSAVVDVTNTSGFGKDGAPALVAMYTAAGGTSPESQGKPFTQCLAFSNDQGRTWTKYAGNPVIPHLAAENRDPKVVWHEATRRWIVALYEEGSRYSLHTSPDLKTWTKLQDVEMPGSAECPDFFPMTLDGDRSNTRWVFTSADGRYLVGAFDGEAFKAEQPVQRVEFGDNFYAAQTFSDVQDGRRIQIAWMRGGRYPGMPFNQQMSFPAELTLRTTPEGARLFRNPVREIDVLHGTERRWSEVELKAGDLPLTDLRGELFDLAVDLDLGDATEVGLVVRGQRIAYHVKEEQLTALGSAPLALPDGRLTLRILVDRTSIETFADGGRVSLTGCCLPGQGDLGVSLYARGGAARVRSLVAYELNSAWR